MGPEPIRRILWIEVSRGIFLEAEIVHPLHEAEEIAIGETDFSLSATCKMNGKPDSRILPPFGVTFRLKYPVFLPSMGDHFYRHETRILSLHRPDRQLRHLRHRRAVSEYQTGMEMSLPAERPQFLQSIPEFFVPSRDLQP